MNKKISMIVMFLSSSLEKNNKSHKVLAILASEIYFRDSLHRTLEYVAWIIFWHLKLKRINTLSLGMAQIQLIHWVNLGYLDSMKPSFRNILLVSKLKNNYNACEDYLNQRLVIEQASIVKLSETYSGKARRYHVHIIETALDEIKNTKNINIK